MSDVDPKVLERIAKLLALAGNNPNPNEAALAMQRAQELMRQHGVSTSDAEIGPIKEHPLRPWASASRAKDYEWALYGGIAHAFGCEVMFQGGLGGRFKASEVGTERYFAHYIIVGPAVDVKVATYAATALSKAMRKARAEYVKDLRAEWIGAHGFGATAPSRRYLSRKADSYCLGWAQAVAEKVEPLVRPSVTKRIKEHVEKETGGTFAKETKRRIDYSAAMDGVRDGKEVQVRRPLDG